MSGFNVVIGANTSGFDAGINRVKEKLKQIPNASNQATTALSNLSRVAQDAPYGFIGIANNLNPLLESFQRLKQTTGSTGSALSALKSSLVGPAGLGLALGVVSSLLISFGDRLFGAKAHMSSFQKVFSDAKDSFVDAQKAVSSLTAEIDLAKQGLISKEGVVNHYNETIGKTTGLVKSLEEAEAGLIANGPAYIEMMLQKSVAQIAYGKAAEKAFKIEENWQKMIAASGSNQSFGVLQNVENIVIDKLSKKNKQLRESVELYKKIGDGALKAAADASKGFNFFSDTRGIRLPKIKIKPEKIELDLSLFTGFENSSQLNDKGVFATLFKKAFDKPIKIPVEFQRGAKDTKGLPPTFDDFFSVEEIQRANDFGNIVSDIITPAFHGLFEAIQKGGNVFKAFGQSVVQSLVQVIEKLVSTIALAGILSLITGGAAGVGFQGAKGFKQIFSLLSGFGGFRAAGGPVGANRPYVVGESGRELFIPSTSGRIVPNNQLGNIGGAAAQLVSVTVNGMISGRDLLLIKSREERYQGRNV